MEILLKNQFAVENRPSDIPDDYYSAALQYMPGKPFGFSELGWSSLEFFGDEQGQADFLLNVPSHLTTKQGIDLHLFGYAWLHDLSVNHLNRSNQKRWNRKTRLSGIEGNTNF